MFHQIKHKLKGQFLFSFSSVSSFFGGHILFRIKQQNMISKFLQEEIQLSVNKRNFLHTKKKVLIVIN